MTRFPHDQFAKEYLKELLAPLGKVETSRDIASEVRQIDVWFSPTSQPVVEATVLGLLGRFASSPCLLEPFRNAVTPSQIRSCINKLFDVHAQQERQAKRDNKNVPEADLPRLWILSPTMSAPLIDGFRATIDEDNWMKGIYVLGDYFRTAVVAIHQLPCTAETLWVRILGKGAVQKQAISELAALPVNHPLRSNALLLLTNLQAQLQLRQDIDLDREEQELIMELSPLVLQWREESLREGKQQGMQQGIQQGQRIVVENLLKLRFGSPDDQLAGIIEPLLELPPEQFTLMLLQLSREELLTRFGQTNN